MLPLGQNGPVIAWLYKSPMMMPSNMTATNSVIGSVCALSSPTVPYFLKQRIACTALLHFLNIALCSALCPHRLLACLEQSHKPMQS